MQKHLNLHYFGDKICRLLRTDGSFLFVGLYQIVYSGDIDPLFRDIDPPSIGQ